MGWFPLVLLSVFISSIGNILQRVLMKDSKSDPKLYAVIFCFLLGILNLLLALIHGFHLPHSSVNLIFFFFSAFLWGVGTVFTFMALQSLESSEVTILTSVRALITIIASIVFLHEIFNVQKSLGVVIILGSILLVTNLRRGVKFNTGVLYALGSALLNGLAVVFDIFNLKNYDPISYLVIINFLMVFTLLIIYPSTIKQWNTFIQPKFLKKMLPVVIFSFSQALAYYFALANGQASQIAPINQAQIILTVLLAVILLGERDNLFRKIIASVLVTLGIVLLR